MACRHEHRGGCCARTQYHDDRRHGRKVRHCHVIRAAVGCCSGTAIPRAMARPLVPRAAAVAGFIVAGLLHCNPTVLCCRLLLGSRGPPAARIKKGQGGEEADRQAGGATEQRVVELELQTGMAALLILLPGTLAKEEGDLGVRLHSIDRVHICIDTASYGDGHEERLATRALLLHRELTAVSPGSAGSPRFPGAGASLPRRRLAAGCRTTTPPMLDMRCSPR